MLESVKFIFWITVPVALVMSFFSYDIFYTIFYRLAGNFSLAQVDEAAALLIAFLPGLFFFSLNKMLLSVYYALHETRYTLYITIAGTILNVLLNRLLMPPYGALGIAVATVLAAIAQSILLLCALKVKFGFPLYGARFSQFVFYYFLQLALCGAVLFLLYRTVIALCLLLAPGWSDLLFHSIGLWFWVAPICLVAAGMVWYLRNKGGVRLYFFD